jgi:hypothetical protein
MAKKKDGTWRFCVDYRMLNSLMRKDAFPLPRIDETLDALGTAQAKIFTTVDLASGYWHIPLEELSKEKTAFTTGNALYQFRVMPFGLTQAPGVFCRAIYKAIGDQIGHHCLTFVDDVIIYSATEEEHFQHLDQVIQPLVDLGFKLKLSKCHFFQEKVEFLGHVVSQGTLAMQASKIEAMQNYAPPQTMTDLLSFLGMIAWYSRFFKDLAKTAAPLRALLTSPPDSGHHHWEIHVPGTPQNLAFLALKKQMCEEPILKLPNWEKPFFLITDGCQTGFGATLCQEHQGQEHPIAYWSKATSQAERRYHSYELEVLALVKALKHFRSYLWGTQVTVVTDCRALSHWNSKKELPANVQRHMQFIAEQDVIEFIHRPGVDIPIPDALSRDARYHQWVSPEEEQKPFDEKQMTTDTWQFKMSTKTQPTPSLSVGLRTATILDFTWETIKKAQNIDPLCIALKNHMEGRDTPEKFLEEVKILAPKLKLKNGLLVTRSKFGYSQQQSFLIPDGDLKKRILFFFHNDPVAGHLGIKRTLFRIQQNYFWPQLKMDVEQWIRNCHSCQVNKKSQLPKKTGLTPLPISSPWKDVHFDFAEIRPPYALKGTKVKNVNLLVFVDRFTKFVELVPTKDKTDLTVIKALKKRILLRHGHPATILTDGGFGKTLRKFLKKEHIHHHISRPHRHTTNGLAERTIKSLREYLRHYTTPASDIKSLVAQAQFALNTAVNTSTGHTPHFLTHGTEPLTRLDLELSTAPLAPPEPKGAQSQTHAPAPDPTTKIQDQSLTLAPNPTITLAKRPSHLDSVAEARKAVKLKIDQDQAQVLTQRTNVLKYQKGDLVTLLKNRENLTVEDKADTYTWGTYRVRGYALQEKSDEKPTLLESVHLLLENPYVGPDSKLEVHQDEVLPFHGTLPKVRELAPKEDWHYMAQTPTLLKNLSTMMAITKIPNKDFSLMHMVGQKIKVKWTKEQGAAGWWEGIVVDYEPQLGKHWIKYKDIDDEGHQYFPQDLVNSSAWKSN